MGLRDNLNVMYGAWKMNCPTPRLYRWVKNHLANLDAK